MNRIPSDFFKYKHQFSMLAKNSVFICQCYKSILLWYLVIITVQPKGVISIKTTCSKLNPYTSTLALLTDS